MNRITSLIAGLISIALVTIIIGCDKDEDNPVDYGDIVENPFALQKGNWWLYQTENDSESTGYFLTQLSDTTIDGITFIKADSPFLYSLNTETENGLESYNPTKNETELIYPYPSTKGQSHSWYEYADVMMYQFTTRVVSTRESINADCGTFENCYKYSFTISAVGSDLKLTAYDYFKPGIGFVLKSINGSSGTSKYNLLKYNNTGGDISDEAKSFVEEHYNNSVYDGYEYWLAQNYQTTDRQFTGTLDEWEALSWTYKPQYLPTWFTRELSSNDRIKYFIDISLYLEQFGIGWMDVCQDWDENNPNTFYMDYLNQDKRQNVQSQLRNQFYDMW